MVLQLICLHNILRIFSHCKHCCLCDWFLSLIANSARSFSLKEILFVRQTNQKCLKTRCNCFEKNKLRTPCGLKRQNQLCINIFFCAVSSGISIYMLSFVSRWKRRQSRWNLFKDFWSMTEVSVATVQECSDY